MRLIFRIIKYLFVIIISAIILPYLLCPFYKYPDVKPFSGKIFYNPYEKTDSTAWRKANFHAHTRRWKGITAGSENPVESVAARYKEIKFDIVGISDYQDINTYLSSEASYIPVYEHGYGITKTHQLVIGAKEVSWNEYILFQTYHNKQDVILNLKKDDEVISLNHPHLRNAYTPGDFKYLKGYDLIEASSHSYFNAADLWDSALSSGNPVFVIADDDNHDINDPADYGYVFTMINCKELNIDNVKSALRNGIAYGVELEPVDDSSHKKKIEQSAMVPVIRVCSVINDTMKIKFNKLCDTLKLYGQNGVIRKTVLNSDSATYTFNESDTYIRAEIGQKNMTRIYLNPVFRYNGNHVRIKPEVDLQKTWLFRTLYIAIIAVLVILYKKRKRRRLTLKK